MVYCQVRNGGPKIQNEDIKCENILDEIIELQFVNDIFILSPNFTTNAWKLYKKQVSIELIRATLYQLLYVFATLEQHFPHNKIEHTLQ